MSDQPERSPSPDTEGVVELDATSVRGLAHPVRVRMLGILRTEGPATATSLAAQLRLNTGATSYHLRQLAAHGFIVEDTTRGTSRERWWRAAHRVTRFDRDELLSEATGEAFIRSIGQIYTEKIHRAIDEFATLPQEWRKAGSLADAIFMLTPDETAQMVAELFEVLRRYRRHDPENPQPAPPGAARVTVQLQAFPDARSLTPEGVDE
jgi:predicted ArsR family transcriptional regulator